MVELVALATAAATRRCSSGDSCPADCGNIEGLKTVLLVLLWEW